MAVFDKACGIIEQHVPNLKQLFGSIPYFNLPYRPQEIIQPEQFTREVVDFLFETFFLPFPAIAVEDKAGLVILMDTEEEQRGLEGDRRFIHFEPIEVKDREAYRASSENHWDKYEQVCERMDKMGIDVSDALTVAFGTLKYVGAEQTPGDPEELTRRWQTSASVGQVMMATPREIIFGPEPLQALAPNVPMSDLMMPIVRNVNCAVEEVQWINSPSRFVVEVQPRKMRDPAKSKKIPRTHERPSFTLLTPQEIKVQTKLGGGQDQGTGKKRSPHQRRRHFRHLKSERFKEARGRTIVIPATWIGPKETTINGRRYLVRTEL